MSRSSNATPFSSSHFFAFLHVEHFGYPMNRTVTALPFQVRRSFPPILGHSVAVILLGLNDDSSHKGDIMESKAIHRCLHVLDLDESLAFYERALGMTEIRRMGPDDGSWANVFIGNDVCGFQMELTWNRGRTEPYDNGGRDSHIAFTVPDFDAAHALHEQMGCICHENEKMGLYFIEDPDGCWLEILPEKAEFAPQAGVDVLAALTARRSVRTYSGDSVPEELLYRIVRAGLLSASGRRRRPWELIIVRDRNTLAKLAECRDSGAAMLAGADAAIAVLGNPEVADTWVEDCSIVMANMHLEAAASGVGSCWIQGRMRMAADGRSTQDFVADLLDIPEPWQLEAILSLGMPDALCEPRTFDETLMAKVHEERF